MNSINIYENKTLKLQNVIVRRLDLESDDQNLFDSEINKIVHTYRRMEQTRSDH